MVVGKVGSLENVPISAFASLPLVSGVCLLQLENRGGGVTGAFQVCPGRRGMKSSCVCAASAHGHALFMEEGTTSYPQSDKGTVYKGTCLLSF